MSTNLLLILALWVDDDRGNEYSEDIFEQLPGEGHFGPVMTLFHDLKYVT